jgi:hypothetical protein
VVFGYCATQQAGAEDAFYKQFLKTQQYNNNYRPTRTFVIISDAEHGNQLVAEEDTELRFNMMWLKQYQPEYKVRMGGAAFGEIVRSYLRGAYKNLRANHAQTFSAFPDENGAMKVHSFSSDLEYHLNWSGRDLELGVHYSF